MYVNISLYINFITEAYKLNIVMGEHVLTLMVNNATNIKKTAFGKDSKRCFNVELRILWIFKIVKEGKGGLF